MKLNTIASFICATLFLFNCGGPEEASRGQRTKHDQAEKTPQKVNRPNEDVAIAIAKDAFTKDHGPVESYDTVRCDIGLFWLVVFDPQTNHSDGMGVMYAISKNSQAVVETRRILVASPTSGRKSERISRRPDGFTREQALDIAKKDAVKAIGSLSKHDLSVCELSRAWLIMYSPKEGLSGGGPEYVIDKNTGDFLDRRYTQ